VLLREVDDRLPAQSCDCRINGVHFSSRQV
jgi:hypothetical protein